MCKKNTEQEQNSFDHRVESECHYPTSCADVGRFAEFDKILLGAYWTWCFNHNVDSSCDEDKVETLFDSLEEFSAHLDSWDLPLTTDGRRSGLQLKEKLAV